MNTIIVDQYGIDTGICIKDTFFNISEESDFIRVCGHVEVISTNYLTCLRPIGIICELLDHDNHVLDYKTWHPPPTIDSMGLPHLEYISTRFQT